MKRSTDPISAHGWVDPVDEKILLRDRFWEILSKYPYLAGRFGEHSQRRGYEFLSFWYRGGFVLDSLSLLPTLRAETSKRVEVLDSSICQFIFELTLRIIQQWEI